MAQAPHGCLLDLIHEGDEVLMERAEGVDHEGRESRADVLRVSIVFEVFGSASALDGFGRTAGAAEVGGGERVDAGQVDGDDFAWEDQFSVRDARAHVFGLEARKETVRAREADKQLHAAIMAGGHRAPTHGRARERMPRISFLFAQWADSRQRERKRG